MLTKKTPETLKAMLTIKAQGEDNTLQLTYWNRTADEYDAFRTNPETAKIPDGVDTDNDRLVVSHMNATHVLYLVKSFDDGTDQAFPLTRDGLVELDRTWPGTLFGIVKGYHQARGAAVEKN